MAYPVPSVSELSTFMDVPVASLRAFSTEALDQATLLFVLATGLTSAPTDATEASLALRGILSMAEKLYYEKVYVSTQFSPFQSETIGSYSYSIAAKSIKNKQATGVMWFDLAVQHLALDDNSPFDNDGISVFEKDSVYTEKTSGRRWLLGPADIGRVAHIASTSSDVTDSGFVTFED